MQKKLFTDEQLKMWFSGNHFHKTYDETVEMANRIAVHANGEYPEELIEARRPNESEKIGDYRKEIWKAVTKPYFGKVMASLNKIRRSTEWSIVFDETKIPARIADAERFDKYLTSDFPVFQSLTNWTFGLLLREWAIDANAWIGILPFEDVDNAGQYLKPYPVIFKSHQIIDATPNVLVVLSTDKPIYYVKRKPHYGDRYIVFTNQYIQYWDQVNVEREFRVTKQITVTNGIMPAFKLKSLVKTSHDGDLVNESRVADMMPFFDEALREYSDLQAEVVQHIYSERWEMSQGDCTYCKGTGEVIPPGYKKGTVPCKDCNGTGSRPRGPYAELIIKQAMAGEAQTPTPPIGYVQKDVEIVSLQDKRFDKHIWRGLSAINMEFLFEKPLNESGIAKAYDADETNNFVHSCAEDLVAIMDQVAFHILEMRYSIIIPNRDARLVMLPKISVPERFDIFSASVIEQELVTAKEKNINPVIVNAMEIEYASKKFSTDPAVSERLTLTLRLDPLPNVSEEDKVMRLQNGGITKETYVLSSNIHEFIAKAIDEKGEALFSMPYKDQKQLLMGYASQQVSGASPAQQIISEVTTG